MLFKTATTFAAVTLMAMSVSASPVAGHVSRDLGYSNLYPRVVGHSCHPRMAPCGHGEFCKVYPNHNGWGKCKEDNSSGSDTDTSGFSDGNRKPGGSSSGTHQPRKGRA